MTSKKPADDVVVATAQPIAVVVPETGHTYVLRAPTFGEVGQLAARQVTAASPSDAVFAEELRRAIEASDLTDEAKRAHLAAIDAHEAAQDHLDSLFTAHGNDRTSWDAEARREIAEAQRTHLAARRAREKAEWSMRDAAPLIELRRHQLNAGQREQQALVALCVESVNGELRQLKPDDVLALPAIDAMTVAARAAALSRPSPAAEKN